MSGLNALELGVDFHANLNKAVGEKVDNGAAVLVVCQEGCASTPKS